jgi:phage virion morphogenesis protein
MTLKFRVATNEVNAAVGTLTRKLNDKAIMQEVGDIIVEDIKHSIAVTKKGPDDKPWKPWAPSTAKGRERKGNAALGLLFDTGKLLRSITAEVKNHGSKGGVQVYIGSNTKYAEWLDQGTEKMPARPFLGVSKRAKASIDEAINTYLSKDKK